MATTTRPAASYALRHFSIISTATAANNSSPPWLTRYLNLWEQQSGTREIQHLKHNVNLSSSEFDAKQHQVSQARVAVDRALRAFERSQLQHTRLLQSRDRWTSAEASEFARILEEEVRVRSELESAKKDLSKLENEQLEAMHKYMSDLRRRYHEEQLWQDKWRVYSTFGTWGLIVLNTVVFLISQYTVRLREGHRMREIQDSIRQSLLKYEGTLRAIEEREQNSRVNKGGQTTNDERGARTQIVDQNIDNAAAVVENVGGPCSDITHDKQQRKGSSLQSSSHYWSVIRQFATHVSSRIIPADRTTKVDLPSAVLGASATGFAWLVVAVAMSGKGSNSR
ncbi:hypothetical protein ACHAW5_004954 [Stephanodiscus triporus]|uniref:Sensitive to high expression protein 9, mitochondrial n=1 Tax=Stephanodiscus triporus TaxID=2934178 RepID=A0ABD3NS68_9STRA